MFSKYISLGIYILTIIIYNTIIIIISVLFQLPQKFNNIQTSMILSFGAEPLKTVQRTTVYSWHDKFITSGLWYIIVVYSTLLHTIFRVVLFSEN